MLLKTRKGKTAGGIAGEVPAWELRAPQLVNGNEMSVPAGKIDYSPEPQAAGVPRLLQPSAVSPTPLAITRSRSA